MLTESLITILEHPNAEKGYREFKKYLEKMGRKEDADAINHLLSIKFPDVPNNSDTHEQ